MNSKYMGLIGFSGAPFTNNVRLPLRNWVKSSQTLDVLVQTNIYLFFITRNCLNREESFVLNIIDFRKDPFSTTTIIMKNST